MTFGRYLLFSGQYDVGGSPGMEGVTFSSNSETEILRYIIKNKLADDYSWFEIFDCTQAKIILVHPEPESNVVPITELKHDTVSELPPVILETKDHRKQSAVSLVVDDEGFDYKYEVDVKIKYKIGLKEWDCDIKHVLNKNRKQLLTLQVLNPTEKLRKKLDENDTYHVIVNDEYELKDATDADLLEMMTGDIL